MDAPVSGGVVGAEKCTLTIMCGHPSTEVFERGKPVLGAMGRRVIHCGGWGMGLAAKTCELDLGEGGVIQEMKPD